MKGFAVDFDMDQYNREKRAEKFQRKTLKDESGSLRLTKAVRKTDSRRERLRVKQELRNVSI